jgi:hypothetical protein
VLASGSNPDFCYSLGSRIPAFSSAPHNYVSTIPLHYKFFHEKIWKQLPFSPNPRKKGRKERDKGVLQAATEMGPSITLVKANGTLLTAFGFV